MTIAQNRFSALLSQDENNTNDHDVEESSSSSSVKKQPQGERLTVGKPSSVKATFTVEKPVERKHVPGAPKKALGVNAAVAAAASAADPTFESKENTKHSNHTKSMKGKKREHDRKSASVYHDTDKKLNAEKGSWGHEQTAQENADAITQELKEADAAMDAEPDMVSADSLVPATTVNADGEVVEVEPVEPELELKSLADFLAEKGRITNHFVTRSANEGAEKPEWKDLAKLERVEDKGLFSELMTSKSKKAQKQKTSTAQVIDVSISYRDPNASSAAKKPFPKREGDASRPPRPEGGAPREGRPASASRGGRGGNSSAPAGGRSANPSTRGGAGAGKKSVNVGDNKAFPSLS